MILIPSLQVGNLTVRATGIALKRPEFSLTYERETPSGRRKIEMVDISGEDAEKVIAWMKEQLEHWPPEENA